MEKTILELVQRILEKTEEAQESLGELDKKLDLHIQKTEFNLSSLHKTDQEQNKILAEHIAGVNTLKKMYENHILESNKRFDRLETPQKAFNYFKNAVLTIGAIGGAIYGILKLVGIV